MAFNTHIEALVRRSWMDHEATFIKQHVILQSVKSRTLKSPVFAPFARDQKLCVIFSVSPKRRTIVSVAPLPDDETWEEHLLKNKVQHIRRLRSAITFAEAQHGATSWEAGESKRTLLEFEALVDGEPATGETASVSYTFMSASEAKSEPKIEAPSISSVLETMVEKIGSSEDGWGDEDTEIEDIEDETGLLLSDDGLYSLDAANNGYWIDSNIFVPADTFDIFMISKKMIEKAPKNLLMVGPSGYGKTTIPQAFADTWEMR